MKTVHACVKGDRKKEL